MLTLPFVVPAGYTVADVDTTVTVEVDQGGYDILIGGHGYRLASDDQNPYVRETEEVTTRRFDSSLEPGEQSLSPLPWIKSQASFHAGAGQLNLEQGFTAFQYQQEQIEHIRYDQSYGVNPWTPGQVTRLPDVRMFSFTRPSTCMTTAYVGGVDYAMCGGTGDLSRLSWSSGPDADPVSSEVNLNTTDFLSNGNCTIRGICTDGQNYYAYVQLTTSVSGNWGYIVKGSMDSIATPTILYNITSNVTGTVGWAKARLVAGVGNKFYSLDADATAHSALPATPNYTHPTLTWTWACFGESPAGVLGAGMVNNHSSILQFELDTSAAVPTLTGGDVAVSLPVGELALAMELTLGSVLAIGTTQGIRVAQFSSLSGNIQTVGPLCVTTTSAVHGVACRDRFIYGSFSNQQADGSTGLVCVDYSMVVDAAGRFAFAPDLRPPTTATIRTGTVTAVCVLPGSRRLVFATSQGIHVEGNGPGVDGAAWLRTSRIRFGTTEPKLFKLARIRGSLDVASMTISTIMPFTGTTIIGTFGFLPQGDPGEFRLPSDLSEWMQMEFSLSGSACILGGYSVKALPAPAPSEIITLTMQCFKQEMDRGGQEQYDPETPRQRWKNVRDLAVAGGEVKLVEFTPSGIEAQMVRVDRVQYRSSNRPTDEDDFGGYITAILRSTEGS